MVNRLGKYFVGEFTRAQKFAVTRHIVNRLWVTVDSYVCIIESLSERSTILLMYHYQLSHNVVWLMLLLTGVTAEFHCSAAVHLVIMQHVCSAVLMVVTR